MISSSWIMIESIEDTGRSGRDPEGGVRPFLDILLGRLNASHQLEEKLTTNIVLTT